MALTENQKKELRDDYRLIMMKAAVEMSLKGKELSASQEEFYESFIIQEEIMGMMHLALVKTNQLTPAEIQEHAKNAAKKYGIKLPKDNNSEFNKD